MDEYKADLDSQKAYHYENTYAPTFLKGSWFNEASQYNNALNYLKEICKKHDYILLQVAGGNGYPYMDFYIYGLSVSQCGFVGNNVCINWEPTNNYNNLDKARLLDVYYYNIIDNEKYHFSSFKDFSDHCDSISTYLRGKGSNTIFLNAYKDAVGLELWFDINTLKTVNYQGSGFGTSWPYLLTLNSQKVKVFSSLQDLKDYQANTVTYPYYMVTPTCSGNTITQSQIDNSVTYGDIDQSVTNIIINNGGITEEQLQRIIDAILAGKGGGSDPVTPVDPTDPVNPVDPTDPWVPPSFDFTGLLKGLMNLLAAIFGLISNLIGYVAELTAELVTSLNAVIDNIKALINQGVIGLLTALFPFLPPEITGLLSLTFLLISIISIIKAIRG